MSNHQDDVRNSIMPGTLSENLELVVDEDKINCMQIDEIADHLRVLFKEECDTLKNDIEFLYECIDKEKDYRVKSRDTLREPSLNELKEERKRLEADLVSSSGKNQVQISRLPASVSSTNNNRSIHSPILSNRITPSPPSSAAGTTKPRSPLITANKKSLVTTDLKKSNVKQMDLNSTSITSTKNRSSSLQKSDAMVKTTAFNSTFSSNTSARQTANKPVLANYKSKEANASDLRPILSRTNSVSSIASSVASSVSSNNSKQSAVQKFRQMVLEHRD